jgi:acetoacetyl-CoA synthetase
MPAARHDRQNVIEELRRALPTVEHVILHSDAAPSETRLSTILAGPECPTIDAFEPEWLPFDHPLWIVYSSGTTDCRSRSCTAMAA